MDRRRQRNTAAGAARRALVKSLFKELFDIGSLLFGLAGVIDLIDWAYEKWGF